MILGLICARAGSQGIPGKNVRMLCGKPLIRWAIDKALECPLIDRVAVNTDIDGYWGDQILHLHRVPAHAQHGSSKWDVWFDSLVQVEHSEGSTVDAVVDIDVTRPLTTASDLTSTIYAYLNDSEADSMIAVARAAKTPYQDILEYDLDGRLRTSKTPSVRNRQDAPACWYHGGVNVVGRHSLMTDADLFDGVVHGFELHPGRVHDIDTPEDWQLVEFLMSQRKVPV